MRGKSHLAMNLSTAGVIVSGYELIQYTSCPLFIQDSTMRTKDFLLDNQMIPFWIYIVAIVGLYFLGALLPDIDHPYSTIGKVVHLPFKHRTWTHAVYFPIAMFVAGIWMRCLFWLGLGYMCHLFWDAFSASGVNWWYPHKSKNRILPKLYHTSQPSEFITVGVGITLMIIFGVFVAWWIFFSGNAAEPYHYGHELMTTK